MTSSPVHPVQYFVFNNCVVEVKITDNSQSCFNRTLVSFDSYRLSAEQLFLPEFQVSGSLTGSWLPVVSGKCFIASTGFSAITYLLECSKSIKPKAPAGSQAPFLYCIVILEHPRKSPVVLAKFSLSYSLRALLPEIRICDGPSLVYLINRTIRVSSVYPTKNSFQSFNVDKLLVSHLWSVAAEESIFVVIASVQSPEDEIVFRKVTFSVEKASTNTDPKAPFCMMVAARLSSLRFFPDSYAPYLEDFLTSSVGLDGKTGYRIYSAVLLLKDRKRVVVFENGALRSSAMLPGTCEWKLVMIYVFRIQRFAVFASVGSTTSELAVIFLDRNNEVLVLPGATAMDGDFHRQNNSMLLCLSNNFPIEFVLTNFHDYDRRVMDEDPLTQSQPQEHWMKEYKKTTETLQARLKDLTDQYQRINQNLTCQALSLRRSWSAIVGSSQEDQTANDAEARCDLIGRKPEEQKSPENYQKPRHSLEVMGHWFNVYKNRLFVFIAVENCGKQSVISDVCCHNQPSTGAFPGGSFSSQSTFVSCSAGFENALRGQFSPRSQEPRREGSPADMFSSSRDELMEVDIDASSSLSGQNLYPKKVGVVGMICELGVADREGLLEFPLILTWKETLIEEMPFRDEKGLPDPLLNNFTLLFAEVADDRIFSYPVNLRFHSSSLPDLTVDVAAVNTFQDDFHLLRTMMMVNCGHFSSSIRVDAAFSDISRINAVLERKLDLKWVKELQTFVVSRKRSFDEFQIRVTKSTNNTVTIVLTAESLHIAKEVVRAVQAVVPPDCVFRRTLAHDNVSQPAELLKWLVLELTSVCQLIAEISKIEDTMHVVEDSRPFRAGDSVRREKAHYRFSQSIFRMHFLLDLFGTTLSTDRPAQLKVVAQDNRIDSLEM